MGKKKKGFQITKEVEYTLGVAGATAEEMGYIYSVSATEGEDLILLRIREPAPRK